MRKLYVTALLLIAICAAITAFTGKEFNAGYKQLYTNRIAQLHSAQQHLLQHSAQVNLNDSASVQQLRDEINTARINLKCADFWLRYLEPIAYKKINGPLPVEWETEVFEKFEKPYKREGAGLTLAAVYLDEGNLQKDTLQSLLQQAIAAEAPYGADSITSQLNTPDHFYLCNRLFLLNLAAIYTTGFECPDTSRIIPELRAMLAATSSIYQSFNGCFAATALPPDYLHLFEKTIAFANEQAADYSNFDHFTFIRDYVNPLYAINQQLIRQYRVHSKSFVDYSLSKTNTSIFNKDLYYGQNTKGIFLRVDDPVVLKTIDSIGKLLFYDPILSGNNQISCNSCHRSTEYFTDTTVQTAFSFTAKDRLPRNTPSLINAKFNHLLMLDGKHISMQDQMKDVMFNPMEMGSTKQDILKKVLSCNTYAKAFKNLLQYTPQEPKITLDHIVSAVTVYYSKFSNYEAPFDVAMNRTAALDEDARRGFNVFMSRAQCATCHFVPNFNGVKPPYVGSEFEVLGVPADKQYKHLSADKGRYGINAADETLHAIRTGSVRNAAFTAPYMHNGVFSTLEEVIEFYNTGGGAGHGLDVPNQTLSSDSLHLTPADKTVLIAFIRSLNEKIPFETAPAKLPVSAVALYNKRTVGGRK